MTTPKRLALSGATGAMGGALLELLRGNTDWEPTLLFSGRTPQQIVLGEQTYTAASITDEHTELDGVDVVIDFSHPEVTEKMVAMAQTSRVPMLVGTTGLTPSIEQALGELAKVAPVLIAPNTSLGVVLLKALSKLAQRCLGNTYDIEMVELHHRRKVDSPSGTALSIGRSLAQHGHLEPSFGRHGKPGPRTTTDLGIHAVRGGGVVGEHTVLFLGNHDRLELTHRAHDRALFAEGALHAAEWLVRQSPGLYTMEDVIGL